VIDRLALGCLLPGFPGLEPPEWVRRRLAEGLGGVVLFAWNVRDAEQVRALSDALHAERREALVAIDEEGGDVTRLEAATGSSYPGNLALGVVDDVALTHDVAAALADDLAAAGIDLDLAPVADVNSNPANPVIGVRSFGADAERVARHVAAFVEGLQAGGVAACAKHFPGHGDTEEDSHLELPVVERVTDEALLPFRAAVGAGVRAIMTAHIRVEAAGDAPATLDRGLLHGLLRRDLGFAGAVVTDALEMRAISATIGVEEGAVRALEAGADALCLGHDLADGAVDAVVMAIVAAVRAGRLAEERLADAAARLAGARIEGDRRPGPGSDVGLAAARRALRVEGDPRLVRPPLVVELRPEPSQAAGESGVGLGDFLPGAEIVRLREPGPLRVDGGRQLVLVVRDAHRHAWERETAAALLTPDAVVVDVGYPGWAPPRARAVVCTFGAGRVNLQAAAELVAPRGA
jgi:beta-N-acetylhexosaminidase